jgi:hypothetical protein
MRNFEQACAVIHILLAALAPARALDLGRGPGRMSLLGEHREHMPEVQEGSNGCAASRPRRCPRAARATSHAAKQGGGGGGGYPQVGGFPASRDSEGAPGAARRAGRWY